MKLAPSLHRVGSDLVSCYLVEENGSLTLPGHGAPWSGGAAEAIRLVRAAA